MKTETKNTILGFSFLLVVIFVVIYFIRALSQAENGAVILAALITAAATIFTIIYNKRKELQHKKEQFLHEERKTAYKNFYDLFFRFMNIEGKKIEQPTADELMELKKALMMWAPGDTIIAFQKAMGASDGKEPDQNLYIMEQFLIQMRKDLGNDTAQPGDIISIIINNKSDIDDYKKYLEKIKEK